MTKLIEKKEISKNRGLALNLISSLVAFSANLIISFFLTPYITKEIGVEAVGFIKLATDFVNYASLVAIALNSMAGRFITIKYYQEDIKEANKYYSSVTIANIIFSIVMFIPSIAIIFYLEHIIYIPSTLLWDVKLLFTLVFINFLISTAFSTWGIATFTTNKLYLQSLRSINSQLLRVIIIVGLFVLLQPSVYYVGIGSLIATIYLTFYSFYYKKNLLPELRIRKMDVNISSIVELIKSGIWNTILTAGLLLLSGLDLLIANLFIGSVAMGMLALAKTVPMVLTHLAGTLASVFTPTLTINYAKGNLEGLKNDLKKSMKFLGVLLTVPLSILFVFGEEFYKLWVPSQDAATLHILSILTIFGLVFTSGVQSLYNIFTVVNKLRVYSFLILLSGLISTIVVFVLLNTTNIGIYAIAAISSIINLIRNMFFTIPYSAKYLNLKWNTFFPEVLFSIISVILIVIIGTVIRHFYIIDSWFTFFVTTFITAVLGLLTNIYIILNRVDREHLFNILKRKLRIIR